MWRCVNAFLPCTRFKTFYLPFSGVHTGPCIDVSMRFRPVLILKLFICPFQVFTQGHVETCLCVSALHSFSRIIMPTFSSKTLSLFWRRSVSEGVVPLWTNVPLQCLNQSISHILLMFSILNISFMLHVVHVCCRFMHLSHYNDSWSPHHSGDIKANLNR